MESAVFIIIPQNVCVYDIWACCYVIFNDGCGFCCFAVWRVWKLNYKTFPACSVSAQNDPEVVLPSQYRDFAWEVFVAVSLVRGRNHCRKVLWFIFLVHSSASLLPPHPHTKKYFYGSCGSEVAYQFASLFKLVSFVSMNHCGSVSFRDCWHLIHMLQQ